MSSYNLFIQTNLKRIRAIISIATDLMNIARSASNDCHNDTFTALNWLKSISSSVFCRTARRVIYQEITMENKPFLLENPSFLELKKYFDDNKAKLNIYSLFQQDPDRFKKFRFDLYRFHYMLNLLIKKIFVV